MEKKKWIEIREKKTHVLIRIIYNPYDKPVKDVIRDWILPEYVKDVYGIKTY